MLRGVYLSSGEEVHWHLLSSRTIHKSKYVNVKLDDVSLPDGSIIQYTCVDCLPFVVIVPILSDKMVMVYNYRYPVDEWCLEFPSGHIDENEKPATAAYRELKEETGFIAQNLQMIEWYYPTSARSNQKAYLFTAEAIKGLSTAREKSEFQRVVIVPKKEVYQRLLRGEIRHSASLVALAYYQLISRGTHFIHSS